MTMLVFLNELSHPIGPITPQIARGVMDRLVTLLRAIKAARSDLALHSAAPIRHMSIGDDYSVALWCNDGDRRDEWRFLRGLENRAPFGEGLVELGEPALSVQYRFQGTDAKGLGWAHLTDGLSISLDHLSIWRVDSVSLTRVAMEEDETGSVRLREGTVDIRHAALPEHVDVHRNWISQACRRTARDPRELWQNRGALYPNLQFLSRVEAQIKDLHPAHPWFSQITQRLEELNASVGAWNPESGRQPQWRSHITPEHENRQRLCMFTDENGTVHCFDLHARFTPDAGRVHFRLDAERRLAVVAHIGMKLGI